MSKIFYNELLRGIVIIACMLIGSLPAFANQNVLSKKGPLQISLAEAPKLFNQCSRNSPKPQGKIWLPSKIEVSRLEERLTGYLVQANFEGWKDQRWHLRPYRGQYVGFMQGGTMYIYASFSNFVVNDKDYHKAGRAFIVCDGGPNSWGIVYNIETGQFSDLESNGSR